MNGMISFLAARCRVVHFWSLLASIILLLMLLLLQSAGSVELQRSRNLLTSRGQTSHGRLESGHGNRGRLLRSPHGHANLLPLMASKRCGHVRDDLLLRGVSRRRDLDVVSCG